MKTKRRVISRTNMPARLPVWQTVTLVLVLDRVGVPGWLWGVALALTGVVWVLTYVIHRGEEAVDVLAAGDAPAVAVPFVTTESLLEHGAVWDTAIGGHA